MEIEIAGRSRKLIFGIGFVRELDKTFQAEAFNMKFGMGVTLSLNQLRQGNVAAAADVIRCALNNNVPQRTIDEMVEKTAEEEKVDELIQELIDEMGKSPVVKNQMKKAEEATKAAEAN